MAAQPTALKPPTLPCDQRADAARNRAKVLEAAGYLFRERGVENVSMDDIASMAGVGKGTLFRRFGDRPGLVRTLVQSLDGQFHDAIAHGPPPLGPGAPPRDRLLAFGEGMLDQLECHGGLALEAERGSSSCDHYRSSVHAFYREHVTQLLLEATPDAECDYLADVLLAALSAEFYSRQRSIAGRSKEELKAGWRELVERLLPE